MVRSIKTCKACDVKFVYHGRGDEEKSDECSACSRLSKDIHLQIINTDVRDDDSCASEGGDEIHCTQIMDENDASVEETNVEAMAVSKIPDSDICFICGANLSKLKRRIDHIKRCSKKHGITGKDVGNTATIPQHCSTITPNNDSKWHGDADRLLKLAEPLEKSITNEPTVSTTRNLNNVLMAASRRLEISKAATNSHNSNTQKKRSRFENWSCPAYKKITGTDFCVDGFHYAKASLTKNYFLTHFHSDHYGGITSSWDVGTIYCSLSTASLVSQQLGVDKKYIHPLPMNTPTCILSNSKKVTVTLLDANHCPGAVMLLFEVGKRTILHVGDFRWTKAMLSYSALQEIVSQKKALDELYLDTTYCNEKYQLPPQSQTIKAILEAFGEELERSNKRTLHLFGAYTIGKEKMYMSVAEHFGKRVYVDKSRWKVLSVLDLPNTELLTTNREDADIWVVPMGHLNMKQLPDYFRIANSKPFCKPYQRIVGYRPTGWSLSRSGIVSCRKSQNICIYSVPYSEHSSFPELVDCLACLKPAKIIPTVQASKRDEQIKRLLGGLRNKQNAQKLFGKKS